MKLAIPNWQNKIGKGFMVKQIFQYQIGKAKWVKGQW
jgi:hypothetical protein